MILRIGHKVIHPDKHLNWWKRRAYRGSMEDPSPSSLTIHATLGLPPFTLARSHKPPSDPPPLDAHFLPFYQVCLSASVIMALRTAAVLARQTTRAAWSSPAPVSVITRHLSGEYNPFTHSLDRLNTKKVSKERNLC